MAITQYFFDSQIKSYMMQFCAIFQGLQVMTGKGANGQIESIPVPIHIGDKDRVVAALSSGNTHNKVFSLPIMSGFLSNIELAPDRRKGIGVEDRRVMMPIGGMFPNDLQVVHRVMPVPYNLTVELSIYASNSLQMHQILEQILVLFDPIVQIQKNDANMDWTKISIVELVSINNEVNYPSGTDKRMIIWSLTFLMPIWLSVPADVKQDLVRTIVIRIGQLNKMQIFEFDDEGHLQLFSTPDAVITIDSPVPPADVIPTEDPPNPDAYAE